MGTKPSNEDRLQFLINQSEERVKLLDTKAAIIIAFYGILLSSNEYFQNVVTFYNISIYLCYSVILLLLVSFILLVFTIRPIRLFSGSIQLMQKKQKKKNRQSEKSKLWINSKGKLKDFDIKGITDFEDELEKFFKNLSEKRILKYNYYRYSMLFLRLAFIPFTICLIIILCKSF